MWFCTELLIRNALHRWNSSSNQDSNPAFEVLTVQHWEQTQVTGITHFGPLQYQELSATAALKPQKGLQWLFPPSLCESWYEVCYWRHQVRRRDSPPVRLHQDSRISLREWSKTRFGCSILLTTSCTPLELINGELCMKKTKYETLLLLVGLLTLHCGF